MLSILGQLAPMLVFFAIGVALRRFGLAEKSHGEFLLRLAFFVTLPLLALISLTQTALSWDRALLPAAAILVNFGCLLATLVLTRLAQPSRRISGAMLVNAAIINNAFMFPFIVAIYGQQGLADAVLFDFGNAVMMSTFVYALAFRYSEQTHAPWKMLVKILRSPVVLALALGVWLSLTGTGIPDGILKTIEPLAAMTPPLILVAVGITFSLRIAEPRLVLASMAVRMGLGLALGIAIATLFGLEGNTFVIVSLCAAAPIGFNAVTFGYLARLDVELISSAVSLSILAGLFYIPFLILLFH